MTNDGNANITIAFAHNLLIMIEANFQALIYRMTKNLLRTLGVSKTHKYPLLKPPMF